MSDIETFEDKVDAIIEESSLETVDSCKSIERFEEIVLNIVSNASSLKEYDYFGASAILATLQLMLSKSQDFVRQIENSCQNCNCGDQHLVTPEEIKSDVDEIVESIRKKLGK